MATDFFQRQDAARRSTKWLVVMFALGVIGIVGGTVLVTAVALSGVEVYPDAAGGPGSNVAQQFFLPGVAGVASLLLIAFGSLYKISQLSGGGSVVAERLGGRRVYPNANDLVERRLLNVVEEMALASGVPVPPVFLLSDEQAINAFAAGYTPSDAVVAVTRGTAENLSRDELQGVVAHEFSHIFNGDMRLNIRLIGLLHGILLLGLVGRIILRSGAGSSRGRSNRNSGAQLLLIGLAMLVLGFLGTLVGNLIKAAVSRQREYLADASAVQFTRNPSGLSGALKQIGASQAGSKVQSPNASEASHMFFATGVWEGLTSLTATHPPLPKRILAIEPTWDGKFPKPVVRAADLMPASAEVAGLASAASAAASSQAVPAAEIERSADRVGAPLVEHRAYVAELVSQLPEQIAEAVHDPFGARAVLFALLLDRDAEIRREQMSALEEHADPAVVRLTRQLIRSMDELDARARLPLVDMAMPALRSMSPEQYRTFSSCFLHLVRADRRLGLFEWTLHRILLRNLRPQYEKTAAPRIAYYGLQRMGQPCSVLLSTLAYADKQHGDPAGAFNRAASHLPDVKLILLPRDQCGLEPLREALDQLNRVAVKQRRALIEACAACICADQQVSVAEGELFRGICDMLDCPVPPLLPGQPLG